MLLPASKPQLNLYFSADFYKYICIDSKNRLKTLNNLLINNNIED